MAIETLYADAHITGTFINPNNAVGSTTGTWAGDVNANSNYTSRWAMANPANPLTAGATQTINVLARKGTNSGTPTISINLWENGVLVSTILGTTNVTSTTGQTLTATFNTSAITSGANVEIEVVQTSVGGSGSARNCAQIDYIQWSADSTAPIVPDNITSSDTLSISVSDTFGEPVKTTPPKIATLTDEFDTQDTSKWTWSTNCSVDGSGNLVITPTTGYGGIVSVDKFDVVDSYFGVKLTQTASMDTGTSASAVIKIQFDSQNFAEMAWLETGSFACVVREYGTNGVSTQPTVPAGTTHMRMKIAADRTITWESFDGTTWTNHRSDQTAPTHWDLSKMTAVIAAGYYTTADAGPQPAIVQSANVYSEPAPAIQISSSDDIGVSVVGSSTTSATDVSANVGIVTSGALRTLVADYNVSLSGSENYVTPTAQNMTDMQTIWNSLEAGTPNLSLADSLNYEVLDYTDTDTSRKFFVLKEKDTRVNYWGIFVLSREAAPAKQVVVIPHTLADVDTQIQGPDIFMKANGRVLLATGTHRNASATLDAEGNNITDVANAINPPSSVLQAIVEVATNADDLLVEPHGFVGAEPIGPAHFAGDRFVVFEAATTATIGIPDGSAFGNRAAVVGDRAFIQLTLRGDYAYTASETGWTELTNGTTLPTLDGTSLKTTVLTRELTQDDITRGTFTFSGWPSSKGSMTLAIYDSCDIVQPIDGIIGEIEPGSSLTSHSTAPLTTTVNDCVLVMFMSVTNATKWDSTGASFTNGTTTVTAKRRTAADTTTSSSSSTSLFDTDNYPVAAGTWTGTAVNATASSIGGFILLALRPKEPARETEIIISPTGAPWPGDHVIEARDALTAAGYNVVANDNTWPYTAAGNVQGAFHRGQGGKMLHVEQIGRIRTTVADREAVATSLASLSAPAETTVQVSSSDTLTASITEVSSFGTTSVSSSDTVSTIIAEGSSFAPITVSSEDTLAVTVTETNSFGTVSPASSDTISISLTETSSFGPIDIAANGTFGVSLTDGGTVAVDAVDPISYDAGYDFGYDDSTSEPTVTLVSSSDSISVSLSESQSFAAVSVSSSDTLSTTLTEAGTFGAVAVTSADTISVTLAEGSQFGTVAVSSTDTVSISISEAGSFGQVSVASTDSIGIDLVETNNVFKELPGADQILVSLVETQSVQISGEFVLSSSDTLSVSASEFSVTDVYLSSSDALEVSLQEESSFAPVEVSSQDTISTTIEESSTSFVFLDSSDSSAVTLSETQSFGTVSVSSSDVLSLSVTDGGFIFNERMNADSIGVAIVETNDIVASGDDSKSSADSLNLTISETSSTWVGVTSADTAGISLDEQTSFAPVTLTTSDSVSVTITETNVVGLDVSASGTLTVGVSESESVSASGGADKSGADTLSVSLAETSSIFVTAAVSSQDSLNVSLNEQTSFGTIPLDSQDALEVSLTETAGFSTVEVSSSDTLSLSLTEGASQHNSHAGTDALTVAFAEDGSIVKSGIVELNSTDTLSPSITETDSREVSLEQSDTLSVQISESTSFAPVTLESAETLSIAVDEQSFLSTSSDSLVINSSDQIDLSLNEVSNVSVADTTFAEITSSDQINVSLSESAQFAPVSLSSNDTLATAINESGDIVLIVEPVQNVELTSSDVLSASLVESGNKIVPGVTSVWIWNGNLWLSGTLRVWNGSSWVTPVKIHLFTGRVWV